jgi:hypothetical protein
MGSWSEVRRDAEARHHVTSTHHARALGLGRSGFFAGAAKAGWEALFPGVRVAPGKAADLRTILVAVGDATRGRAIAAGRTAAWLHGLEPRPPARLELVTPHEVLAPEHRRIHVRRVRWLEEGDAVEVDRIRTLAGSALALSAARADERSLRALLIDASHRGILDLAAVLHRLEEVGPIPGRTRLRQVAGELVDRGVESIFEEEVRADLRQRGYQPSTGPKRIATPDGRGLTVDIALPWRVGVEPEGDAHHRSRDQRRSDRRRTAQFAGTDWVPIPVDWRDWQLEPDGVRAAIDAAVLAQARLGRGAAVPLPPHLSA